jgi:hypothetical protein
MSKINIQSFREEYFNYIKRFNDITVENLFVKEIISFFFDSLTTNNFFNAKGGNKYELPKEKVLEDIHATEMSELSFDCDKFIIKKTDNIVIIGAGPIGLCIAILIKKYIPDLDVVVLEKRQTDNKRKFEREQIITSTGFAHFWQKEEEIQKIENFFHELELDVGIHSKKYGETMLFTILNVSKSSHLSINKLEFELSQIAEELGILIVCENADIKTETDLKRFINPQTLSVFDATGGRLDFNTPNWNNKKAMSRKCSYLFGDINNLKNVQKMRENTQTQTQYYLDTDLDFYYLNCSNLNPKIGDTVLIGNSANKTTTPAKIIGNFNETNKAYSVKYLSDDRSQYVRKEYVVLPDPKINIDEIVTDYSKTKQGSFVFSDKGMNLNNIKKIKDIPLISIGDSFRSSDFTTGTGLEFGIFHSMICALIFKKVHNDQLLDKNPNVTNEKDGGSKTKHHKKRRKSKTKKRRKFKKAHK